MAARPSIEERVWTTLGNCYDPEIPVNIVDLGLVYDVDVVQNESRHYRIRITMTLTAPGCAMADYLKRDIETKVSAIAEVDQVNVGIVFDPPWDPSRMSEAAKLETGLL